MSVMDSHLPPLAARATSSSISLVDSVKRTVAGRSARRRGRKGAPPSHRVRASRRAALSPVDVITTTRKEDKRLGASKSMSSLAKPGRLKRRSSLQRYVADSDKRLFMVREGQPLSSVLERRKHLLSASSSTHDFSASRRAAVGEIVVAAETIVAGTMEQRKAAMRRTASTLLVTPAPAGSGGSIRGGRHSSSVSAVTDAPSSTFMTALPSGLERPSVGSVSSVVRSQLRSMEPRPSRRLLRPPSKARSSKHRLSRASASSKRSAAATKRQFDAIFRRKAMATASSDGVAGLDAVSADERLTYGSRVAFQSMCDGCFLTVDSYGNLQAGVKRIRPGSIFTVVNMNDLSTKEAVHYDDEVWLSIDPAVISSSKINKEGCVLGARILLDVDGADVMDHEAPEFEERRVWDVRKWASRQRALRGELTMRRATAVRAFLPHAEEMRAGDGDRGMMHSKRFREYLEKNRLAALVGKWTLQPKQRRAGGGGGSDADGKGDADGEKEEGKAAHDAADLDAFDRSDSAPLTEDYILNHSEVLMEQNTFYLGVMDGGDTVLREAKEGSGEFDLQASGRWRLVLLQVPPRKTNAVFVAHDTARSDSLLLKAAEHLSRSQARFEARAEFTTTLRTERHARAKELNKALLSGEKGKRKHLTDYFSRRLASVDDAVTRPFPTVVDGSAVAARSTALAAAAAARDGRRHAPMMTDLRGGSRR